MKLFALPRALKIRLQLDRRDSVLSERIAQLAEPAGEEQGTGRAGVLWARGAERRGEDCQLT